ncbi:hypothetical protein D3874_06895 [Oleomonas cavernae]|uniref:Uncharacterized protein n=1 Tax=Oleomonas cavernae TaxID=2320859 RepID=A0A418W9W1_9PROT|nr:hypothetical protein [Oleomonas cavernae]RJF86778.1 hypothetical protein D3874_06895 [Oleomonas cavernae]
MGRIVIIAALVSLGVLGAAAVGAWIAKRQGRLEGPSRRLPVVLARKAGDSGLWTGIGILVALIVIGFLIKSPTQG